MTKSELVEKLSRQYPQPVLKDAEYATREILNAMSEAILQGQHIEIRGIGRFALNYRRPRRAGAGRQQPDCRLTRVPVLAMQRKQCRTEIDLEPLFKARLFGEFAMEL